MLSLWVSLGHLVLQADPTLSFNRDIRPILSAYCLECHGPDGQQRKGGGKQGLRLDTLLGATEDLGGVSAVIPGCLLYTSPSPRDQRGSRMPSSA